MTVEFKIYPGTTLEEVDEMMDFLASIRARKHRELQESQGKGKQSSTFKAPDLISIISKSAMR